MFIFIYKAEGIKKKIQQQTIIRKQKEREGNGDEGDIREQGGHVISEKHLSAVSASGGFYL
jgi:hypothetical protein